MRGKRERDRAKRTRTGPSKNLGNVCEPFARERERDRKRGEICPLLRALLLRRTVTNNYRNRPEINKLSVDACRDYWCSPTVKESI